MPAPRARAAMLGVVLGLGGFAVSACNRASEAQQAKDALEGRNPRGTSARSLDDRVPPFAAAPIGARPGYVEGAFVYASARARVLATLGQASTTRSSELTELAELLDLGVAPGDYVSLSLRSFGSAATRDEGDSNSETASVGVHARVHLPVDDRPRFEAGVAPRIAERFEPERWPQTCAALGPSLTCAGDRSRFVVVRAVADGYVADLFATDPGEPDDPTRRALIEAAVALPGGRGRPELQTLHGDAAVLIDGPRTLTALLELPRDRQTHDQLERLHATERLFEGVTVELALEPDRLLARGRWLVREDAAERLRSVFELDPVDADVPSIAALCEGALICGRSRGLPARQRFAGLATGIYADVDALTAALDEDSAKLVLALETWPNAIATTTLVPAKLGDPAAALVVQNAAEIGARVLGFGFAIRSQRSLDEGRVAYARLSAADLDGLRGFLQIGGSSFAAVTIPGVDGRVEAARTPSSKLPDRLYTVYDAGAWGWGVVADDDEQVAWLAGLAHDDGAVPLVYLEIPDLGRLLAAAPGLGRALGSWSQVLVERGLRAQLTLAPDWSPELRVAIGRLP